MTRRLIVNADDFGRTRGVSLGIVRAHLDGIVTGTTAMMNLPKVVTDLHHARAEAPNLGLGVHLNFTMGRPLMPTEWVSSLVDEHGRFWSQDALLSDPARINPDELRSELKSQITTFKNAMERLPDHLDAHHFIYLYPPLFRVFLEVVDAFKLPARIPFPRGEEGLDAVPAMMGDVHHPTALSYLRADQQFLAERSIKSTDHFISSFYDQQATLEHLLALLKDLPEGTTEMMVHPGEADDQLKAESGYTVQREQEITVLTHPQVLAAVKELDIQLITFAGL